MKLGIVTIARYRTNPPICERCKKKIKVGDNFYFTNGSKKKYCEPCGDKIYQ